MKAVRTLVVAALAGIVMGSLAGCGGEDTTSSGSAAAPVNAAAQETGVTTARAKEIYNNFCFSCHAAGLSGAPKLGDVEAWAPRVAKGRDLLIQATIEGVPPAMPARGICFDCSDAELAATVDYMTSKLP